MDTTPKKPEPIARPSIVAMTRGAFPAFPNLMLSPTPADSILFTELRPAQPPIDEAIKMAEQKRPNQTEVPMATSSSSSGQTTEVTNAKARLSEAWKHISSILNRPNDVSVREKACEAMKDFDVDFFLPQLCLLLVYLPPISDTLERFVLDRCAQSLHFAIQFACFLSVLIPTDADHDPRLAERIENYRYACQLAYINGVPPTLEDNANPVDISSLSMSTNDTEASNGSHNRETSNDGNSSSSGPQRKAKDMRFKYMWSLKRLMRELSQIGHQLADTEETGRRSAALRTSLSQLNEQIRLSAQEPDSARYVTGLFLPLLSSFDPHYALLKVPEHEATLLASKTRVPFCLCFETVSLPSLPQASHPHLEEFVPSYSSVMNTMIQDHKAKSETLRTIATPPLLSPSSSTDSGISASSLSTSMPIRRANSESMPIARSLDSEFEDVVTSTAAEHLQYLLSVPQNANSIQTKEKWKAKESRIRAHSIYGSHPGWKLRAVIVKYGVDSLQEQLALQLMKQFSFIFESAKLRAALIPYDCLVIEGDACLIEPLLNAESIHQIKKNNNGISLYDYFVKKWHGPNSKEFQAAQSRFLATLAGSSLACYILQLKDRHNANIMLDDDGNVIHIDWGFLLSSSPGAMGFESSPFKLTSEMIAVLGGTDSQLFTSFKSIFLEGYMEIRKHSERIIDMVKIMFMCDVKRVPCSSGGAAAVEALRARFCLDYTDQQCVQFVEDLISQSLNNWRTTNYDYYQYYSNGIHY